MIEYRSFGVTALMADEGKINGLAAPFNSQTMIGESPWGFREQIAPGAFSKTLQEADVVFLYNHDSAKPLARKSAGTLNLRESERGLEVDAQPNDTSYAQDLIKAIKHGDIRGMSFGFEVVKDDWTDDEGNPSDKFNGTNRYVREVKLHEVSAVTFPAYDMTDISARDTVSAIRDIRDAGPYGNVTYADPKNKKYPIDTKAHCKAAWAFINIPANAAKYPLNGVKLADVKAAIVAACKKFGVDVNEQNGMKLAVEWRAIYNKRGEKRLSPSTTKRVPQIAAALNQSLVLFAKSDIDDLPDNVQQAIALVSSATTHISHIKSHEGLKNSDAISANDAKGRSGEPGSTTPANEQDEALRLDMEFAEMRSREAELGSYDEITTK